MEQYLTGHLSREDRMLTALRGRDGWLLAWQPPIILGCAGGRATPSPPSLFYLPHEVIEPGSEDVDVSVGCAMLHLLGDK